MREQYKHYINNETKNAMKILFDKMKSYADNFDDVVMDTTIGLGKMFEILLKSKADFLLIVTDAKYFASRHNTLDYITSLSGLNNISDTIVLLLVLRIIIVSAIWPENLMDILPVAWDAQYFAIIAAKNEIMFVEHFTSDTFKKRSRYPNFL